MVCMVCHLIQGLCRDMVRLMRSFLMYWLMQIIQPFCNHQEFLDGMMVNLYYWIWQYVILWPLHTYNIESFKKVRSITENAETLKHSHYGHLKENYLFTASLWAVFFVLIYTEPQSFPKKLSNSSIIEEKKNCRSD